MICASRAEQLAHGRLDCRDYLRGRIARYKGIFGLLFMRPDGSLFGALPEGNFFLDDAKENLLPKDMKALILNAPLGQTVLGCPACRFRDL